MSNIYSTPEQPPLDPEKTRLWLLGEARFGTQQALLRQHQQIAVDLARQRVIKMQLVEKSTEAPTLAPVETEVPLLHARPVSSEQPPLSTEQINQEAVRQQLLDDAYRQINEAHAA